jgi:acyl-CoA dehydrogenase
VRALCVARETLAPPTRLADFAFAMQGLGAGPVSLFGDEALRERYLPRVRTGAPIAAFALSERAPVGRRRDAHRGAPRRRGLRAAGGEDVDLERGDRGLLRGVRRLPRRERGFAAFVVDADAAGVVRRPHRRARAAPLGT